MKLNKKNKGKVHPLSPSPSSSSTENNDEIAALKLILPTAILTIIAVLSLQEREVLAYMITRSIKAAANPAVILEENLRRRSKNSANLSHKSPEFDCGCFDCYTSYWFRWDSSPNRELIHQAIEAFEEHFASGEQSKNAARGKKREKAGGKSEIEMISDLKIFERFLLAEVTDSPEKVEYPVEDDVAPVVPEEEERESPVESSSEVASTAVVGGGNRNHKGLARKVLPDVIGLFQSRLWSLWSPN